MVRHMWKMMRLGFGLEIVRWGEEGEEGRDGLLSTPFYLTYRTVRPLSPCPKP